MKIIRFNLAVPEPIYSDLKIYAKQSYSTMTGYIVATLKARLESEKTGVPKCADGQVCIIHSRDRIFRASLSTRGKV